MIVVSFNTREFTLSCLRSIFRETRDLRFEVIVVDNASSDGSAEAIRAAFPQVTLLAPERNLGFGVANNLAAKSARGEFIVLLNPDTQVTSDAVGEIVRYARTRSEDGIIGGRTLRADGSLNPSSCWGRPSLWSVFCRACFLSSIFPRTRLFDPTSLGRWKRDTERDVDVVSGCFLSAPRRLWRRLGGFDESFFMYGEDVDLSLRSMKLGANPRITPKATLIHVGAASEPVKEDKLVRLIGAHRSIMRRHFPRVQALCALRIHTCGVIVRYALARVVAVCGLAGRLSGSAAWIGVWRRRAEWQ